MRIQLVFFLLLFSVNTLASDDKSMQELFNKYDAVMDQKKIDLIDEVFTEKFIKSSGGKKELIEKIRELPEPIAPNESEVRWKKGLKGKIYFAKIEEKTSGKKKAKTESSQFIVVEEKGKLKIDGTISDDQ